MTVTIEPLAQCHISNPKIKHMLQGAPAEMYWHYDANGGIARVVLRDGDAVGLVAVTPDLEAIIAIHPDYYRQGIATAALLLVMDIAAHDRGMSFLNATTLENAFSNGLLAKLGASEVGRKGPEIFYRIDLPQV
jgi:RimJ/RimL family protein N-acetyltransferase